MKQLIFIVLIFQLSACQTTTSGKVPNKKDPLDQFVALLDMKQFQGTSNYTITKLGDCKYRFVNHWSSNIAKKKGYHTVTTEVTVSNKNYIKTKHKKASTKLNQDSGRIENWAERMDIELKSDTKGKFITAKNPHEETSIREYYPYVLSFSVKNPNKNELLDKFILSADNLFKNCTNG